MAATVLNSERAVETSVFIVRAFVRLRELLASDRRLAAKIAELEHRQNASEESIVRILVAIRKLMAPKLRPRSPIGFRVPSR